MKKPLHEIMGWSGPMTHRQFLGWKAWLRLEMNRPSRTDQYIMAACVEIRRVLHKHPAQVKISDFLLRFESAEERKRRLSSMPEEVAQAQAMSKWLGAAGSGSIRVFEIDDPDYDPHTDIIDPNDTEPDYIIDTSSSQDEDGDEGEEG